MRNAHTTFAPKVLLFAIMISGISTFMIYPLLVFRLLDVGLSVGEIGLIIGVLSGTGRIASFAIGHVNNKVGSKLTVCLGLVLRVIGISVFAFETSVLAYIGLSALASVGSSSSALGIKTELLRQSAERKIITLRSMAINVGAIAGPALGAALYHFLHFHSVLYISIAAYVLLAGLLAVTPFAPPESTVGPANNLTASEGISGYARFVYICLIASGYWALYSQWSLVVPLISEQAFGYKESSNILFMLNAVVVLVLQYPIVVVALKSVPDPAILLIGFAMFFGTFLLLLPNPTVLMAVLFCVGFSLAELLISPSLDSQTAKVAPPQLGLTRSYGLQDTVTGAFSIGGAAVGGWAIEKFGSVSASAVLGIPVAILAVLLISLYWRSTQGVTR